MSDATPTTPTAPAPTPAPSPSTTESAALAQLAREAADEAKRLNRPALGAFLDFIAAH